MTPAGLHKCEACPNLLQECWRFRDDDQFCGLCGNKILHLQIKQTGPDGKVWIYLPPSQPPVLTLSWNRPGATGRPLGLRPEILCARSGAHFGDHQMPDLQFEMREAGNGETPGEVAVSLVPLRWRIEDLKPPETGVPGELHLVWPSGSDSRRAVLLPSPARSAFACHCIDPSNRQLDGAVQVYQRGHSVSVPMELRVPVPVWLLPGGGTVAEETHPDVGVLPVEAPLLLRPDEPFAFTLHLDTAAWPARQRMPFRLGWNLLNLKPLTFRGEVMLVEGEKVEFGDSNVWEQELLLGRVARPSFLLSASEETGTNGSAGISLEEYQVALEPDEGEWLRVVVPPREELPLLLRPRGQAPPCKLQLEVDTTRLDRQRFDGKLLKGTVELRDDRHRRWTCEVRLTVRRPPELNNFLAIDWGTTNSCAAYRGRDQEVPCPVRLHRDQRSFELFPSDMYFVDVSDRDRPVFLVGDDAAYRGLLKPECCLRSVKRKFQFWEEAFVMDEHGRTQRYRLEELVKFLLLRLVALAEDTEGREITKLGLTFPTKWPPRVRSKLKEVCEEVAREMERQRGAGRVVVREPEIDEANAVALNLLTARKNQDQKEFYLVAYDFGGGTVDTSVLHVRFLEKTRELCTDYVGIGGRGDFGGDDVTRAVMLLLHQQLTAALRGRTIVLDPAGAQTARLKEIPLVADGEELRDGDGDKYKQGRKNWDALWKAAEAIKIDLCGQPGAPAGAAGPEPQPPMGQVLDTPPPARHTDFGEGLLEQTLAEPAPEADPGNAWEIEAPTGGLSLPADSAPNPMRRHLLEHVGDVTCQVQLPAGSEQALSLENVLRHLHDPDHFYRGLLFTLEDVCKHPLPDTRGQGGGRRFTVRERVEDTVEELIWQCRDRGIWPHIIVLAGGGCRLPLVSRMLRERFVAASGHEPVLDYDADFAKQRVAHGMANYLFIRQFTKLARLARSVKVLHRHLGIFQLDWNGGVAPAFRPVVRVGTPINDPKTWHPFAFACPEEEPQLPLFFQDWRHGPQLFGYFDLARPAEPQPGDEPCEAGPLPLVEGEVYEAGLRLRGARTLEIRVSHQGKTYGPYPLVAGVADPEAALQS
jgi:hypothetical protein